MSYQSISVKEAVEQINAPNNAWLLPYIQRPFVWGSRYESEKYICKLFDSILRGYPIGGLIIWNTPSKVPYREFIKDYNDNETAKLAEEGCFGRADKWLVYDGQQRLQTLFSCLRYTFNNKILVYDLLFNDKIIDDVDETGFSFRERDTSIPPSDIKMNELFTKLPADEIPYRNSIFARKSWTDAEKTLIETNLHLLWKIFVEKDKKSLAYFPIITINQSEVNEIFQRLNSGGIPLSESDLLFSLIKETYLFS